MKKNGFTLAEVLIALTIIGVVSALTIPTLVQKTNKQEYVSALQKAYSTLSQAANMIIAEEGSPKCDDGGWACSTERIYELFKKRINNIKDCEGSMGCFAETIKMLSGGSANWDSWTDRRRLVMPDGTALMFDVFIYNDCNGYADGSDNICAWIWADINGNKKPNQVGQDVFRLVLKEKGLFPSGCDKPEDNNCNRNSSGYGCACKVLTEGKMDY